MNTKEFIIRQTLSANTAYIKDVKEFTFAHIDELLNTKGAEYSNETNRFENFLDAGRMENIPPEHALWFMMLKHWVSIHKFVFELVTPTRRSLEKWNEKIDDIITYLILLKAMIRRRTHIEQVVDAGQYSAGPDCDEKEEKPARVHGGGAGDPFKEGEITPDSEPRGYLSTAEKEKVPGPKDPPNNHGGSFA